MACGWLFVNANPQSSPHSYKFHAHHCIILPVRLMDAVSLGGLEKGGDESIGEGKAVGRAASVSIEKQGMTPNVRPDREIQHTSHAPPRYPLPALYSTVTITFSGCVSTSVLSHSLTYALTIGKISIFRFHKRVPRKKKENKLKTQLPVDKTNGLKEFYKRQF